MKSKDEYTWNEGINNVEEDRKCVKNDAGMTQGVCYYNGKDSSEKEKCRKQLEDNKEEQFICMIKNDAASQTIPNSLQPESIRKRLQENSVMNRKDSKQKKRLTHLRTMTAAACVCLLAGCAVMAVAMGGFGIRDKKAENRQIMEGSNGKDGIQKEDMQEAKVHTENASRGFRTVTYDEVYESMSQVWEEQEKQYRYYDSMMFEAAVEEREESAADLEMSANKSQSFAADDSVSDGLAMGTETPMAQAGSVNGAYGSTNIQTVGVDEGDIVKNDGRYLYQIVTKDYDTQSIQIADTLEGLKKCAVFGEFQWIDEFYVWEDLLIVIENKYMPLDYEKADAAEDTLAIKEYAAAYDIYYRENNYHQISIYDISNRNMPKEQKVFTLQGSYQSSRIADGYFYGFSRYYANPGTGKEDYDAYVPLLDGARLQEECIVLPNDTYGTAYLVMVSIDLTNPSEFSDTIGIVSDSDRYYVSSDNIYVTYSNYKQEQEEGWNADQTTILRFAYDAGKMTMEAEGSIKGYINDTFSMDEYEEHLRIVTTVYEYNMKPVTDDRTGEYLGMDVEDSRQTNALYVLDKRLNVVGKIEGLAKDEQIYSARFFGDTGYFVTFRQTDPLFAVDLSSPSNPEILSELKVSGFSEYLHFYGENRLFGFGMEADEETGIQDGIKLSMFDITNPADVQEITRTHLEDYYYSEALYEHHAILIHPSANVIGFSAEGNRDDQYVQDYKVYTYENDAFVEKFAIALNPQEYGYTTVRGTFIGDVFYLLYGDGRIQSYDLHNGEALETIQADVTE